MHTYLIVDGDILAYQAASACQRVIGNPHEDAFGYAWAFADAKEGRAVVDNMLSRLRTLFDPVAGISIAISDTTNWRKDIMPSYKANRDDLQRPVLLKVLKDYLREQHKACSEATLEADDLIGVWATGAQPEDGRQVIVGKDKDFQGIPGLHFTLGDIDGSGKPRVREITKWQATRFHLVQALAGDRVDGYGGCPGIGMERAARIVDNPQRLVPRDGVITAGKNKGQKVTKWFAEPTDDYWACIVSNYRKAGKTEADALLTAQVARILLFEDFPNGEVKLWTPDKLRSM